MKQGNGYTITEKTPMKSIIAQRITLMILNGVMPAYMYNSKLALFSKINSTNIETIDDIRPIGVLPVFFKLAEKIIKEISLDNGILDTTIE